MAIRFLSLLMLLWLPMAAVWAAGTPDQGRTHCAGPLFFVTDREQRTGKSSLEFGAQVNDPLDRITYGAVDEAITSDDSSESGEPDEDKKPCERIYPAFSELACVLRSAMVTSDRAALVIFVHGCCISFREAVRQAKELSDRVETPVVLYDWGSPVASYPGSLLACPRSQERFNCFMRAVAHEFPRERIIVVGLSLGNVLIDNFFLQHRPNEIGRTFDQVIFARADMDLMAFKSHLPRIAAHVRKVFVYVDDHDFVINLSQLLRMVACPVVHGKRVGRMTSSLQTDLPITVVDVSPLNLQHDLPCGVISDLLASDGANLNAGNYQYVELANGILRVEPKQESGKPWSENLVERKSMD